MSNVNPRFTKITNDAGQHVATLDTTTGLEWAPVGTEVHDTQQAAETAAGALELLGGGWHLATIDELGTIIDRTRHDPACDADAFPFVSTDDWYWSSTVAAWSSASAWGVLFSLGDVYYYHRSDYGFALAVRRAGQ